MICINKSGPSWEQELNEGSDGGSNIFLHSLVGSRGAIGAVVLVHLQVGTLRLDQVDQQLARLQDLQVGRLGLTDDPVIFRLGGQLLPQALVNAMELSSIR